MGLFDPIRDRASPRAFWLAIPIALELWWVSVFVQGWIKWGFGDATAGLRYIIFGGAVYGTVILVFVILLVAVPAYLVLARLSLLSLP
jgi:hypothetical protein